MKFVKKYGTLEWEKNCPFEAKHEDLCRSSNKFGGSTNVHVHVHVHKRCSHLHYLIPIFAQTFAIKRLEQKYMQISKKHTKLLQILGPSKLEIVMMLCFTYDCMSTPMYIG